MTTVTIQKAQANLPELIHKLPFGRDLMITENDKVIECLTRQVATEDARPGPGFCKSKGSWGEHAVKILLILMRCVNTRSRMRNLAKKWKRAKPLDRTWSLRSSAMLVHDVEWNDSHGRCSLNGA